MIASVHPWLCSLGMPANFTLIYCGRGICHWMNFYLKPTKDRFKTLERARALLREWDSSSLTAIMSSNVDKSPSDCWKILLAWESDTQASLFDEYRHNFTWQVIEFWSRRFRLSTRLPHARRNHTKCYLRPPCFTCNFQPLSESTFCRTNKSWCELRSAIRPVQDKQSLR